MSTMGINSSLFTLIQKDDQAANMIVPNSCWFKPIPHSYQVISMPHIFSLLRHKYHRPRKIENLTLQHEVN